MNEVRRLTVIECIVIETVAIGHDPLPWKPLNLRFFYLLRDLILQKLQKLSDLYNESSYITLKDRSNLCRLWKFANYISTLNNLEIVLRWERRWNEDDGTKTTSRHRGSEKKFTIWVREGKLMCVLTKEHTTFTSYVTIYWHRIFFIRTRKFHTQMANVCC